MAKKKTVARRVPRTPSPRVYSDGQQTQVEQPATDAVRPAGRPTPSARPTPGARPSRPQAGSRGVALRYAENRASLPMAQEYHYVVSDLRRLAVLAVSVFAVLVVMGFLIR